MDIIDILVKENPILQNNYDEQYKFYLDSLKEEKKAVLKENEWWKEYITEDEQEEIQLDYNVKYELFCNSLLICFNNFEKHYIALQKIFLKIEEYLIEANEAETARIEILVFETLANNPALYKLASLFMGEKSKLLCIRNKKFWEKVTTSSIAGALRLHKDLGLLPQREFHIFKAEQGIKSLQKWITDNPTARPGDHAAAENIMKDLIDSIRNLK